MKSDKSGVDRVAERVNMLESFADAIKSECSKLRETLGRVHAPTYISKKKKDHYATLSKILANRQTTIRRRQDSTDSHSDGNFRS